jgi:ribose/xylose/arabinose/galactoside ABC-type transport system permease subunit
MTHQPHRQLGHRLLAIGYWSRCLPLLRRVLLSEYLVLWLSVAYFAMLVPFTPGLVSPSNLANILITLLPLFVVAVGQTGVMISGGIDLSATSIIAVASVLGGLAMNGDGGWLANRPLAAPAGVLLMLAAGAFAGFLNGAAISRFRMPPFIVTLTSMMFFSGLAIWLTRSKNINNLPASFNALGGNPVIALVIAAAVGTIVHLMLSRSLFGRWLYAVGHNPKASLVSGVPVNGVVLSAYVISGVCAAGASVLYTGLGETATPVLGQRILLDVIGATVIGGASLFGGKGKIVGTLFGVLFLKLIDNSLNLLNLSLFTINMTKGAVILLAAIVDAARTRLQGRA